MIFRFFREVGTAFDETSALLEPSKAELPFLPRFLPLVSLWAEFWRVLLLCDVEDFTAVLGANYIMLGRALEGYSLAYVFVVEWTGN